MLLIQDEAVAAARRAEDDADLFVVGGIDHEAGVGDRLLGGDSAPLLTDEEWRTYEASVIARHRAADIERRRAIDDEVEAAWNRRHRPVREWLKTLPAALAEAKKTGKPILLEFR